MRLVLDTNVLIAAFATRGLSKAVVDTALVGHDVFASEALLAEVHEKLLTKLRVPRDLADSILAFLESVTHRVALGPIDPGVSRDPDDAHVLALARDARADLLVTGDKDLLVLGGFEGIPIVSPRALWTRLQADEKSQDPEDPSRSPG